MSNVVGNRRRARSGISIVYMVIFMVALCAFCSLAVDYGRVQLAKTELHRAADAAARAAVSALPDDPVAAINLARRYASLNKVDGTSVNLDPDQDIQLGTWDGKTFKLHTGSGPSPANAIRIIARRSTARGNALPMMFAGLIGFNSCQVNAESIAMAIPAINVDQYVPATANPFLSGMPPGSQASNPNPHNNPDRAGSTANPRQSPLAVGMPISPGQVLTFDSISGVARHDPNLTLSNPDGDLSEQIGHNNLTTNWQNNYSSRLYNENGIADAWVPINALIGVFLDDNAPNQSPAPDSLDFRDPSSRDFDILKPKLKQIFFIGDGLNSAGNHQQFVAPPGAARLFLATMDYYEWNNNSGYRNIQVNRPIRIITVR